MDKKSLGYYGENLAADYLLSKGYQIIGRNFTVKGGEIDLIAQKGKMIIFIEVKTRTSRTFGDGEDAFGYWKKQRMKKAMYRYVENNFQGSSAYRTDFIQIELSPSGALQLLEHFEDVGVE